MSYNFEIFVRISSELLSCICGILDIKSFNCELKFVSLLSNPSGDNVGVDLISLLKLEIISDKS